MQRKISELERKIETTQQQLSDAKQRYSELRSIRQDLENAVQHTACVNGGNHNSGQSSHMHAQSSTSATYGVANTLALTSRLPEQVAALATAWGMHSSPTSSGAVSHSMLQQAGQTSPGDTVHSSQAPQTPNSIACSLLAQLSSSGSGSSSGAAGGGDVTASVHQHGNGRRHPTRSKTKQGASSSLPGHLRDPVRSSMTLPDFPPRVPSATGMGSSILTAPMPPIPSYHLLPESHTAQMSALPAPLLDHFPMHALNAPVELPVVSSGRPHTSLWGTVRGQPHNNHNSNSGEPDLLSAPLDTDPMSLAEVLSQCRSASEPDLSTPATNVSTPTSHLPSVFPVPVASTSLHVNPFLRGAGSSALEFATIQASASIVHASMGMATPLSPLHNAHAQSAFLPHHFMEQSHQQPHLQSTPAHTYPQVPQHPDLQYSAGMRVSHSTPNIRAQWNRQHEHNL